MTNPPEPWVPGTMPAMLVSTAARMFARLADTRFRSLGISTSQFPVFVALKDGGSLSQKELTRLAGVEQSSMAQLLARMERDGLIRREADPRDGRSSLISLTESAVSQIEPARAILALGNNEGVTGFDRDEIDKLVELLQRLIINLSAAAGPPEATSDGGTLSHPPAPPK